MKMNNEQFEAFKTAREITVTKLSTATSTASNKETGIKIGEMFTEIYKAALNVLNNPDQQ